MTRDQLIKEFRLLIQDEVAPYLFSQPVVMGWLDEAQREAAVRARLLHESSNPAICEIGVEVGESSYPLHPALYEIDHLSYLQNGQPEDTRRTVALVSATELDHMLPGWRKKQGRPLYAVQHDTTIRLAPTPDAAGELSLEGFRLPLEGAAEIEINAAHHQRLVDWMLLRAYSLPDSETLDLGRAEKAKESFDGYFGLRTDSNLRRWVRTDEVQHVSPHWV